MFFKTEILNFLKTPLKYFAVRIDKLLIILCIVIALILAACTHSTQATLPLSAIEGLIPYNGKIKGFEKREFFTDGVRLYRTNAEKLVFEIEPLEPSERENHYLLIDKVLASCGVIKIDKDKLKAKNEFVIDLPRWERARFETLFFEPKQNLTTVIMHYQRLYQPGFSEYRVVLLDKINKSIRELCSHHVSTDL
jgi:hypothetical protein